jgi:hypothetical protein
VVCGDTNINTLVSSTQSNSLNDILDSYNQVNYVTDPTRMYGKSSTCIDQLYLNFSCSVIATVNKNCISDHFGIHMEQIIHGDMYPVKILKRKFLNNKLPNKLNSLLELESWSSVYDASGVEEKFDMFNNLLLYYLDKVIPVSLAKSNKKSHLKDNDIIVTDLTEQVNLFEEMLIQSPGNLVFKI